MGQEAASPARGPVTAAQAPTVLTDGRATGCSCGFSPPDSLLLSSLCSEIARLCRAAPPPAARARGRPLPARGRWACPLPHQPPCPGSTRQAPGPWGFRAWARLCWDWGAGGSLADRSTDAPGTLQALEPRAESTATNQTLQRPLQIGVCRLPPCPRPPSCRDSSHTQGDRQQRPLQGSSAKLHLPV